MTKIKEKREEHEGVVRTRVLILKKGEKREIRMFNK